MVAAVAAERVGVTTDPSPGSLRYDPARHGMRVATSDDALAAQRSATWQMPGPNDGTFAAIGVPGQVLEGHVKRSYINH
jgi:hypothetical protein